MFKPLLRTLPSLTGNVKLACEINDYVDEGNNVYSTYIRSASLQPLQNNLYNRRINVNLINGMWEYDVAKFYKYYSNYFYKQNFAFLYDDFAKLDLVSYNSNSDSRNKDYEFGCKHISYNNTGYMLDFYAPIFINSVEDLPEYFEIRLDFENGEYKKIRVHINTESNLNYLKVYIEKYLHKINRNVAYFISNTGRMIYYGIDVEKGGLVDIEDTHMSKYLTENTTVNNFDSELCAGFINNKLIMRQILPLSFHFNIDDIISTYDKLYFIGHKVKISAHYYKNSLQCKFYDFDINYTNKSLIDYSYSVHYKRFVTKYRLVKDDLDDNSKTYYNVVDNNSIFGLHEKFIKKYYYTNAITPMYTSWKMMLSSDSCPYVTNINYVYTNISNGIYGQFPKLFVKYDTDKYAQLEGTNLKTLSNVGIIQNTYISNWYTILNKYSTNDNEGINENINTILNNLNNWFKVENNYAYYKGILYNFNNCEHINDIDYFGVFVKPTYSEISNVSNLYNVTVLSNCKELDNGKKQLGDISINEQLHDKLDKLSNDYDKNDYLNDIYDFDNNYIYEDGKIVDANGANAKIIDENVILSKYTKTNLFNENDITDKKLYITIDSVNTKHNNYIKLIDLFNIDFLARFNGGGYSGDNTKSVFETIVTKCIFDANDDNILGLKYNDTFNYNLLRFSTLMLQKTSLYNSICINNADTFTGFLLNYRDDVQFSREASINLNSAMDGTKHKWNIFVDENGQVYEANVYISKNALISIVQYILSCIKNICNDEESKSALVNKIQSIAGRNYYVTNQNVIDVLNNTFINIQENKMTVFENMFIDILDNEVDNYEFIFYNVNLRNNLSLSEYYNAINSICLARSLKQPYDYIVNNQWPFTSIDVLLAHINRNTLENSQVNGDPNSALPNIHFVENGYVEKIEKLPITNPLNVDGDNDSTNYSKTLFIDAAYINKYEKSNREFYTKYYDYLKNVYGEPYRFYDALFGANILRLRRSFKTIEETIIDYSNNDENLNEFDSLYNVGNYTNNLYKIKGPQYFFNTINNLIVYDPSQTSFDSIYNTIDSKLKYSFTKFEEVKTDKYNKFDKYFPTILTEELTNLVPKFDLNYWLHENIGQRLKGSQQYLETYFTTVLSRIVCKNNLDRLTFEINTGAPITFKEDELRTNTINDNSIVYSSMHIVKNRDRSQFNIKQQFSNKTTSYFYKYNINDNSIYNILTTHAMSERFDFDDIEAMNPTYLSYPLLYDNVMKLFNVTNNEKTSVYLFVGSPFLLLPGIAPFDNNDRGIFVNYENNTNRVKFGTIPFISKDSDKYSEIVIRKYPNKKFFDLLNNETDANKIEQYYDTSTKQINVLFENLCEKVNNSTAVNNYDKYNPTKYNSNSNALFMFTDLGLSSNIVQMRLTQSNKQLLDNNTLYVYPNTFICSEFATLQDISSYYKNIEYFNDKDGKTQNIAMALISSLKNSYLHNVRNFSEVLRFYKNNDTCISISNICEYVDKTINNLIDQAYCYDKTWKTFLDTLWETILKEHNHESFIGVKDCLEFKYLNYIFHELMLISTSYRKVKENRTKKTNKYYDQYSEALQKYINDKWICDITIKNKNDWKNELKKIIYEIIWPLVKSMNIYRQLLETIKLYEVDTRQLKTEVYDNNDMLKFIKIHDGEYYSKIMSVETEEKLANTTVLSIQYTNKYSFKAEVSKLYEKESYNKDFNYFTKVHEIIPTIISQCENYLEKDEQITNDYVEFYEDLYSKKELLPLDEHLLKNITDEGYQYYIYELCDESDRQCSTLKYSKEDIKKQLKHNFFNYITNDIISISNTDKIYYAKLFEYTENNIYKNVADKNMLLSLLNDNHIFSSACNPSSIYGKYVCDTDEPYNVYHYKKDNILFATQLNLNDTNDTNYSILSELIKDNLINVFKHVQSDEYGTIYNMLKILSDVIYVLLNKFDNNEIHNKLFDESSFANILSKIINDISTLINNSLTPDRTHIDFTRDIYTSIYGENTELQLKRNCSLLTDKLNEWYNEYWKENIPTIDTSFENIILDINKNNRSLTNIAQDLENFRQEICDENNSINTFKIFKHIAINVCKNLPYKDTIIQIIEHISNIYNGKKQDEQIIAFCNNIISNIANENEQIRTESRHILAQLLNYFIIYHDMTLYAYVMNNEVSFGKLCNTIDDDNIVETIDNIDNNLHIIERTDSDGKVTKYAYYCLNLNITNSSLHYNIDGIPHNTVMTFNSINNDYIESNKKMFIDEYFNLLYPLLKVDLLLNMLQQSKIVQKPYQFQQRIVLNALKNNVEDFQTCYYKYDNGEHYIKKLERSYNLYKVNNARNTQVITLNRYLNYIEPILKETDVIRDFKSRMFKTNNTIYSAQNLFTENISIKKYNPIIVFNKLEQYNISLVDTSSLKYDIYPDTTIKQYEYKHFNDNHLYMLENSFEYESNKLYTYDELLKAEDNAIVYNLFKNYIRKRHNNLTIDENEILFLFNKYNVTFKSNFSKLDLALSNKLYTLKYIFSLK